jgi:hypothetical protein
MNNAAAATAATLTAAAIAAATDAVKALDGLRVWRGPTTYDVVASWRIEAALEDGHLTVRIIAFGGGKAYRLKGGASCSAPFTLCLAGRDEEDVLDHVEAVLSLFGLGLGVGTLATVSAGIVDPAGADHEAWDGVEGWATVDLPRSSFQRGDRTWALPGEELNLRAWV